MNDPQFYQTRMGRIFYEATMPELVKQLQCLNDRLGAVMAPTVPVRTSDVSVVELLLATHGLANAAEQVLEVEIVPGSEDTLRVFRNLRAGMTTAREAARAIR